MAAKISSLGFTFMGLLALQVCLQPMLNRTFISENCSRTSIVLVGEVLKFGISLCMLVFVEKKFKDVMSTWTLKDSLRSAGLPAIIYAFQNQFLQIAYRNLDGLTFNVLNQTKVMFTAGAVYYLMGRKQSRIQIAALCGLIGGSILITLEKPNAADDRGNGSFSLGVGSVLIASLMSGCASGLSQLSLQAHSRNSLLFTMELSTFSFATLVASTFIYSETGHGFHQFFRGWSTATFYPVVLSGLGGIFVGMVTKYAGGVRKGFSIMMGILLTGLLEISLGTRQLSLILVLSLLIVTVSTYFHIQYPYQEKTKKL